jgi:hypothetical protein
MSTNQPTHCDPRVEGRKALTGAGRDSSFLTDCLVSTVVGPWPPAAKELAQDRSSVLVFLPSPGSSLVSDPGLPQACDFLAFLSGCCAQSWALKDTQPTAVSLRTVIGTYEPNSVQDASFGRSLLCTNNRICLDHSYKPTQHCRKKIRQLE